MRWSLSAKTYLHTPYVCGCMLMSLVRLIWCNTMRRHWSSVYPMLMNIMIIKYMLWNAYHSGSCAHTQKMATCNRYSNVYFFFFVCIIIWVLACVYTRRCQMRPKRVYSRNPLKHKCVRTLSFSHFSHGLSL